MAQGATHIEMTRDLSLVGALFATACPDEDEGRQSQGGRGDCWPALRSGKRHPREKRPGLTMTHSCHREP